MTPRNAFRISFVCGSVVLFLSIVSASFEAPPVCGQLPSNYAPIIAFEMARSVTDLQAIFGATAGDCRTAIREQMDLVNWLDALIYIPMDGAFLFFCLQGLRGREPRYATAAGGLTIVACVADYAENVCLFQLAANPDFDSIWLTLLALTTEVKWVGLGVVTAVAGYLLARGGSGWRLALVPCSMGVITALISVVLPATAGPYLSASFAVGWAVLLTVAARESFRRGT